MKAAFVEQLRSRLQHRLALALALLRAQGYALAATVPRFDWIALRAAPFERIGLVLALVGGGALVYLTALLAFGVRPAQFMARGRRSSRDK